MFPLHASLPDGKRVTVNRVTDQNEVSKVYAMIQESAGRGDGYGIDEFPTERCFVKEVQTENGKIFQVSDHFTGMMMAAFVILDSKYYRGQGTVADSYVVVDREARRKGLGEFCMQMVLQIAPRMGYTSIYNDTFSDNLGMQRIIEQSGFQKVGVLPMSGRMPDGSLKSSNIYYRELPNIDIGIDENGGIGGDVSVHSSSSSTHQSHCWQSEGSCPNFAAMKPPARGDPVLLSPSLLSMSHQSQFAAMVGERGSNVVGLKESDSQCVESSTLPS